MDIDGISAKVIRYTFYGLLAIVPLIWLPGHVELFQFNKMMAVYLGTVVITAAWLIRMIAQKRLFIRRTPLDLPLWIFFASQVTSTILSIEPHTSIWGYYSRFHGGLLSTISYLLLYYGFVTNFMYSCEDAGDKFVPASWTRLKAWLHNHLSNISRSASFEAKRISVARSRAIAFATEKISVTRPLQTHILTLLASATIVAIYGILEHFGIDEHYWIQDVRNRVFSTLGQPNWLAAFLVAVLPLSFILPFLGQEDKEVSGSDQFSLGRNKSKSEGSQFSRATMARLLAWLADRFSTPSQAKPSVAKKIAAPRAIPTSLAYILLAIFYLTLLYTKSRSGLLGFSIMYFSFWGFLYLMDQRRFPIRSLLTTSTIIGIITIIVGTPFTPSLLEIVQRIRPQPPRTYTAQAPATLIPAEGEPAPTVAPTSRRDEGGTESGEIRSIVWRGAINVWRNWPVFGSGVETFAYSYYNFRPVEHNTVSEWDFLYNKAHNEYLNELATTGLFGLASFLLLQGWYIIWSFQRIAYVSPNPISNNGSSRARKTLPHLSSSEGVGDKFVSASWTRLKAWLNTLVTKPIGSTSFEAKRISVAQSRATPFAERARPVPHGSGVDADTRTSKLLLSALLSGYLGLSVAIFFGFSTVTDGLILFLFPAFAVSASQTSSRWFVLQLSRPVGKPTTLNLPQKVLVLLAILGSLYLIFFQIGKRWYADRLFARGRNLANANRMSEALLTMQFASQLVPREPVFHDRLALDFARSAVALYLADDATNAAQLAQAAAIHSDITIALNPVHLNFLKNRAATLLHLATIDSRYRKFAEETLLRATYLAPTDPNLPYNLGLLYQQEGELQKAQEQFQRAIELKPDYELPRVAMAQIYESQNLPEKAYEVYQDLLIYDPDNPNARTALERLATEAGIQIPH